MPDGTILVLDQVLQHRLVYYLDGMTHGVGDLLASEHVDISGCMQWKNKVASEVVCVRGYQRLTNTMS